MNEDFKIKQVFFVTVAKITNLSQDDLNKVKEKTENELRGKNWSN